MTSQSTKPGIKCPVSRVLCKDTRRRRRLIWPKSSISVSYLREWRRLIWSAGLGPLSTDRGQRLAAGCCGVNILEYPDNIPLYATSVCPGFDNFWPVQGGSTPQIAGTRRYIASIQNFASGPASVAIPPWLSAAGLPGLHHVHSGQPGKACQRPSWTVLRPGVLRAPTATRHPQPTASSGSGECHRPSSIPNPLFPLVFWPANRKLIINKGQKEPRK